MLKIFNIRKVFVFLISVCMLFSSFAFVAAEETGSDIAGHWAEETLTRWIAQGFIGGYEDGRFQPNHSISRAEFVSLINRSFGLTGAGTVSFTDLDASHWAYSDVAIAVQAGYISGYEDKSFRASQPITRQEVAIVIQRLLNIADDSAPEAGYADQEQIAAWARGAVDVVSDRNILGGYEDGSFQPTALMTRAEAVVTLDRALAYRPVKGTDESDDTEEAGEVEPIVYDTAGTYGPAEGVETVKGDVIIAAAGVTLRNMEIEGNLTFAEEIGDGDAFLKNVTVHGETFIYGGGEESLYFDNTVLVTVTIDKQTGAIRIVATGATTVSEVVVHTPVKIEADDTEEGSGINTVKLSEQLPEGSEVILTGTFENVEVASASIKITIPSGSVENFTTTEEANDMTLELGEEATIVALVLNVIANILGEGTIQTATLNDAAQDSTFEKEPEERRDTSGEVISTPSRSSGSGGGSRGGGGGGQTPKPEEPTDEEEPVDEEDEDEPIDEDDPVDEEEPAEYVFNYSVHGGNGTVQAHVGTGDSLPNERTPVVSGDLIKEGMVVFFLAEPDTGYRVKSWSYNGHLTDNKLNTFSILVNQELNVVVEFEAIPVPSLTVTGPDKVAADAERFTVTFAVSHDNELAYLEIDHNLGKHGSVPSNEELPEFKLYPNVDNPWAPADMEESDASDRRDYAESQGLVATYDADRKTWTLTFGNPVLGQIKGLAEEFANNQFKIYSIVKDVDGNQSGSMNDGSYETTIVEFEKPDLYAQLMAIADDEKTIKIKVTSVTGPVTVDGEDRWKLAYDTLDLKQLATAQTVTVYRLLADGTVREGKLVNPDNNLVPDGTYVHQKSYGAGDYTHLFAVDSNKDGVVDKYYRLDYSIEVDEEGNHFIVVDGTKYDKGGGIVVEPPIDLIPPVITSATVNKDGNDNLILTVKANDENLYSLEVDHSHGKHGKWSQANLPEFTVYASEENPYGTPEAANQFIEMGVTVEYDAETQTWTITFEAGKPAMNVINDEDISNGEIEFYLVVHDIVGNSSGSMNDNTYEKVVYP